MLYIKTNYYHCAFFIDKTTGNALPLAMIYGLLPGKNQTFFFLQSRIDCQN